MPIWRLMAKLFVPPRRSLIQSISSVVMRSPLASSYGIAMSRRKKENEISALKPLVTPPLIQGRIFTLDTLHTQRALCTQIHRFGVHCLLIAKDNQPTLHEDIADLFKDWTPDRRWKQAKTWDKGHGRLEYRHINCIPDLYGWFAKHWEGIEQVFRLERTARILRTNQIRHEVVYGPSSLSMRQAPPARMLSLIRDY